MELLPLTLARLLVERATYKISSFQNIRSARLILALQRMQKIPLPTLKGIKFILDEMAEKQPRAKNVAPESFVDLSLLQELDQSGFFKQLWKN